MPRLYHYFERSSGPFRSLSSLPISESEAILEKIRRENRVFAAHRYPGYLERRIELEAIVRDRYIAIGGSPQLASPHYMVWEACPWLETWYIEPAHIAVPLEEFDPATLSFTYGDSFPTFSPRVQDGKEYRGRVYSADEIADLISRYGLPQAWNPDGARGPERYIEAHVWSDTPVLHYRDQWQRDNP